MTGVKQQMINAFNHQFAAHCSRHCCAERNQACQWNILNALLDSGDVQTSPSKAERNRGCGGAVGVIKLVETLLKCRL